MAAAERLELEDLSTTSAHDAGYPMLTTITPELVDHCKALMELFDSDQPQDVHIHPASSSGWFWDGHLPGVYLWTPAAAAALIALKQLSRTKQKRRFDVTHVVLIPRLPYWEEWHSCFEKEMDIWFAMHNDPAWPTFTHKPLLVGLSFPMDRSYPWLLRLESKKVVEIGRFLSKLRVTYNSGITCANYGVTRGRFEKCKGAWCAGCFKSHKIDCFEVKLPRDFNGASLAKVEDLARFRLQDQSQNIRGRDLDQTQARDQAFEALVIQATLDAFWSHTTSTVTGHVANVRFVNRYGDGLGFAPLPTLGTFPLGQHGGMLEAILLLMRSTEKRKKGATVQFATARKVRGTLTQIGRLPLRAKLIRYYHRHP
eukprot:CCRYP_000018-RA/>CCRYP_000018-RA protein AED:0.39 eAED:0.53 QI:0/0/0/1/0/0/4/0/368